MPKTFQREKAQECFAEALPLLAEHWQEIAHYKDIPLEPDYDAYAAAENSGNLVCFTARTETGELIGYAVYFLRKNLHYKSSLQAYQDILFISKPHRGMGGKFILWCDDQLRALTCQAVYQHVKKAHNFGPLLERIGYTLVDLIFAKRLDV